MIKESGGGTIFAQLHLLLILCIYLFIVGKKAFFMIKVTKHSRRKALIFTLQSSKNFKLFG